jgi:hypothetical protein
MVFNAPFNNISVSFIGRKSRIPVFFQKKNEKEEFSPSLQVGFSIVDLKLKELS